MAVLSDIEIASKCKKQNIVKIAKKLGLKRKELELYGDYKAKITRQYGNANGKLILVTAINPTSAGEGKTTVSIGLADGLNLIHKKVCLALREPSLGPVFGVKGGATGGGYSQVVPMDDINLHFTGDFHAITSANNLLASMIDNHIHFGNELNIDTDRIVFNRCVDLNDRALRNVECARGGKSNGVPRKDVFNITSASETMAIMCLAKDLEDLKTRVGNILVAYTKDGKPVFARDLHAQDAMTILLKDALKPNLVQTLIGTPAIIHLGPFANIAHGCNSITATKLAMTLADYTVTEAGFGADLGAEKFLDVKCRVADLKPNAVVVVATIRALKLHGGANKEDLKQQDLDALQKGLPNLVKHLTNIRDVYHLPVVCAINQFVSDTLEEIDLVKAECAKLGIDCVLSDVFSQGGKGAIELAKAVVKKCEEDNSKFEFSYNTNDDVKTKIKKVATKIYGASKVVYTPEALEDLKLLKQLDVSKYPVVIAKTQYSLTDDKDKLGAPKDFAITISRVQVRNGAGFIVPVAGSMLLMPGLSKKPAAVGMTIDKNGVIKGLF